MNGTVTPAPARHPLRRASASDHGHAGEDRAQRRRLRTGAEVTRRAHFLGRRIDYVLRVAAYEPPRLLDTVSVAAPLPMHVIARQDCSSLTKDLRDLERRLPEPQGDG